MIFELVDVSNEEMYFSFGLYLSEGDAVQDAVYNSPEMFDYYSEDIVDLEVRAYSPGWRGSGGKPLYTWKISWVSIWSDERDDSYWVSSMECEEIKRGVDCW